MPARKQNDFNTCRIKSGAVKNKSGFVGVIAIAILRLPLTRELSSKARLRERKGCVFMRSYFSPSVFLLTQKATSQLPFRSVLLSLRLEIATGNPHPRQREARAVATASPLQTPICLLISKQARQKLYFSAFVELFDFFLA